MGISGFARRPETAAETLDVIKRDLGRAPSKMVPPLNESEGKRQDDASLMSELTERYTEISKGIREKLQEADSILKEMDDLASRYGRTFDE